MFLYDWTIILLIPGILLTFYAQSRINSVYGRYSAVMARSGLTGVQLAEQLMDGEGIYDVPIERASGRLGDHYDPARRVLRLSGDVGGSSSVAALGVAAHEVGHVLQHRDGYSFLALRSAVVPVANIGSNLSWPLVLLGLMFSWEPLVNAGILLFCAAVAFTLITLPVEFDASRRALAALSGGGYLEGEELSGAKKVLSAAALTYVAAAVTAILQLMRLLAISGRNRRRN